MNKLFYGICCLYVVLLTGHTALAQIGNEQVMFPAKDWLENWKVGLSQRKRGRNYLLKFVLKGQTIASSKQVFTIFNLRKIASTPDPEAMMNKLKAQIEKRCSQLRWDVIERQEDSILYEWRCSPFRHQHEIVKIIYTQSSVWRITFMSKVLNPSPEDRDEWITRLSEAKVMPIR